MGFADSGVWVARNKGDGTFADATFVLNDFGYQSGQTAIKHIFVLMMENRSFDHFLGFSKVKGTDTQTGQQTSAHVLTGDETNSNAEAPEPYPQYQVNCSAGDTTVGQHDVLHQFTDVSIQLCPARNHTTSTVAPTRLSTTRASSPTTPASQIRPTPANPCGAFRPKYLSILNQLANEFVLCDHWYSSMAGPTEPNRMFAHAATSGLWDDSPSHAAQIKDEIFDSHGIHFGTGTDLRPQCGPATCLSVSTSGDGVPNVVLLKGIGLSDIELFEDFERDVMDPGYDAALRSSSPTTGRSTSTSTGSGTAWGLRSEAAIEALQAAPARQWAAGPG